ncbi:MAG: RNA polymerase sigma factor [Balneolaceae bacterium]
MSLPDSQKSEKNLIHEILNGNRELYRVLVDRYSPMVFYVVRTYEQNEDEVKELGQEIFVKAYERLNKFRGNSKFSTWLYSLASNHCRDYVKNIRRSNIRFSETEDGYMENIMTEENTPDKKMEALEWSSRLNKALDKISVEYSEPLLLKYRDGLSYESISEQLDVSVSALKVRVHRARKELQSILGNSR